METADGVLIFAEKRTSPLWSISGISANWGWYTPHEAESIATIAHNKVYYPFFISKEMLQSPIDEYGYNGETETYNPRVDSTEYLYDVIVLVVVEAEGLESRWECVA